MNETKYAEFKRYATNRVLGLSETTHANVRAEAVAIFTWPRSVGLYERRQRAYVQWTSCGPSSQVQQAVLSNLLKEIVSQNTAHIALVERKLYLKFGSSGNELCAKFWSACQASGLDMAGLLPGMRLECNTESTHVTLVNSDVVAALGLSEIELIQLLARINAGTASWNIGIGEFRHTLSLDYAPIAACVVAPLTPDFGSDPAWTELEQRCQAKL